MDFDDTPAEAAFRRQVRTWIEANAPHELRPTLEAASFGTPLMQQDERVAHAKAWQMAKARAGYAGPGFPKAYGGAGFSPIERVIWQQEEGPYAQLGMVFSLGHGICGPTLLVWADEARRQERIPPLINGEEIWCQLFSEPAAGSDLAGLRTRAEPSADGSGDWVVNGQKIWTSHAQFADWGLLIARTDPTVPKHKGLTAFYVSLRSPGLEIRPIKQANGRSGFNEVYFTDVRVPDAQRLGDVGQGWQVSLTTLMNERMSVGAVIETGFPELVDLCDELGVLDNRAVKARLASFAIRENGLKATRMRAISSLSRGETPGPENSISKLVAASMAQEIAAFALDLQGASGVLTQDGDTLGRFQAMLLRSPALRIEGGSDEILRNIIAERVLGLPGDVRVDKTLPFNEIPASGRKPG